MCSVTQCLIYIGELTTGDSKTSLLYLIIQKCIANDLEEK